MGARSAHRDSDSVVEHSSDPPRRYLATSRGKTHSAEKADLEYIRFLELPVVLGGS
jgi:hypothetical protein